jgi:hydroxyacylglutathione hydrolase
VTSPADIGVIRVRNGVLGTNSYLCPTSAPGACLLIDPGFDRDAIAAKLEESGMVPVAILCTHGHFDHLGSADHFRQRFGVRVHVHEADWKTASSSNFLMMAFRLKERVTVPPLDPLADGLLDPLLGGDRLQILPAPGHTPGSVVLLFRGQAFTGDTLYASGVGLVSLPGEDELQLRASLRRLWVELPDDTSVHPGHGEGARFAAIKSQNGPLRAFVEGDHGPALAEAR